MPTAKDNQKDKADSDKDQGEHSHWQQKGKLENAGDIQASTPLGHLRLSKVNGGGLTRSSAASGATSAKRLLAAKELVFDEAADASVMSVMNADADPRGEERTFTVTDSASAKRARVSALETNGKQNVYACPYRRLKVIPQCGFRSRHQI